MFCSWRLSVTIQFLREIFPHILDITCHVDDYFPLLGVIQQHTRVCVLVTSGKSHFAFLTALFLDPFYELCHYLGILVTDFNVVDVP